MSIKYHQMNKILISEVLEQFLILVDFVLFLYYTLLWLCHFNNIELFGLFSKYGNLVWKNRRTFSLKETEKDNCSHVASVVGFFGVQCFLNPTRLHKAGTTAVTGFFNLGIIDILGQTHLHRGSLSWAL